MTTVVAAMIAGCDDTPEAPANVQELARQREEEAQRVRDEIEKKRREAPPILPADEPPVESQPMTKDETEAPPRPDDAPRIGDNGETGETSEPGAEAAPPAIPTSPVPARRSDAAMGWDAMKAGMTADDVVKLLGKPTRIASDVFLDYWYYGQGRTAGRVAFIRASQMTMAWDPPID